MALGRNLPFNKLANNPIFFKKNHLHATYRNGRKRVRGLCKERFRGPHQHLEGLISIWRAYQDSEGSSVFRGPYLDSEGLIFQRALSVFRRV